MSPRRIPLHRSCLVLAACWLAPLAATRAATVTITDTFADGSRWGDLIAELGNLPIPRGGGSVAFDGRMSYLCSSTAESNIGYFLKDVTLRLDRSWSLQVDMHIEALPMSTYGQFAWLEFGVVKTGDPLQANAMVGFERGTWGSPVRYELDGESVSGGVEYPGFLSPFSPITAPDIAVRMDYNATSHLLTVLLDRNAALGGYTWETIGSTDLVAPASGLNLGPTDSLTVLLIGTSEFQTLAGGQAWMDNFVLIYDDTPVTVITQQPQAQTATAGGPVTLQVASYVSNGAAATYQWHRDGVAIAGATSAVLVLPSVQAYHAGSYTCVVTANGVVTVSQAAMLAVSAPPPNSGRMLNLSTRALVQTGDSVLIPGFVVEGTGTKRLLIRAVGPGLSIFNLGDVLPDPRMVLKRFNPATNQFVDEASNDNWGTNANAATIVSTAAAVGAFPLTAGSADAALLVDLAPGRYSVISEDTSGRAGTAIVEFYDVDADPPTTRLVNLSNRGFCGVGTHVMIPGLVVSPDGPRTLLVRVVGPQLASFGVSGVMADPRLTIYSGQTPILDNDNWGDGDAAGTIQASQQVSAFPLDAGSRDAALVVTLNPGNYTAIGTSADGSSTGVVLVEVYIVQ